MKSIKSFLILLLLLLSTAAGATLTPETPGAEADGTYLIDNAGKLLWFADYVNGQPNGRVVANAKLTADIDLQGEPFPLIGVYNQKKYAGTFDGQGHTIEGFSYEMSGGATFGRAFFPHTDGATLRNFTLRGEMTITNGTTPAFIATVVGLGASTTMEDVHSAVDIIFNGGSSSVRIIGGLAGRFGGTVNRCRYSGTIDASQAPNIGDRISGLVAEGNANAPLAITNSLFDGTIRTATTATLHKVGGMVAAKNGASISVSHCLSAGNYEFAQNANLTTCGLICGEQNIISEISNTYYTASDRLSRTGVNSGAAAVGTTDWSTILYHLNQDNSSFNWRILAGADHPVPALIIAHDHTYATTQGVCTVDGCMERLQPATLVDGYYEIGNTGQLLWFGQHINAGLIPANSNARLTASITDNNMPLPEFSGIGTATAPYAGIFDGQGFAITSSFTTASGTGAVGMFAYLAGTAEHTATIQNLTLEGTFTVSAAREGIGALVGHMGDYTLIDNVHAHVDINVTHAAASCIGGLVGIMDNTVEGRTVLSMACYADTIDVASACGPIGGLVGDMRGGKIENAIFDGKIRTASTSADLVVGGLAGQAYRQSGTYNTAYLSKCLSHGTITATDATSTKLGSVMGRANQVVLSGSSMTTYYVNSGVSAAFGEKAAGRSYETFTDASSMTKEELRTQLGETNWAQGDAYPYPQRGGTHTHTLDANGFCPANDGYHQEASLVDGYYRITNAGQFHWFAEQINAGTIPANSNARLMNDINMGGFKWGLFPMLGNAEHPFTGEFDGQGHTISDIYMWTQDKYVTCRGMFIAAAGAHIHSFRVSGIFYIANDPGATHGGITGRTNGADYTDVDCAISVQCLTETSTTSRIGGFAGLADGGSVIRRCRFSGVLNVLSGVYGAEQGMTGDTHEAIGGLFGQSADVTIANCLFDGTITPVSRNAELNVGGLIGYVAEANKTTLSRSFSHGAILLPEGTYTRCGAVIGSGQALKAASASNYFTTSLSTGITAAAGSASQYPEACFTLAPADIINSWTGLLYRLGDTDWHLDTDEPGHYPTPQAGTHQHRFVNGFCAGEAYDAEPVYEECIKGTDGFYAVDNGGKLWWLATEMNAGRLPNTISIKLTADISLDDDAHGSFPGFCPLGSKQVDGQTADDWTTAFRGTFDGHGHTISGFYAHYSGGLRHGLFNTTEGATVKNFLLDGRILVTGSGNSSGAMCAPVIGHAHNATLIEGVSSSVSITGSGVRSLGGLVGCMEDATSNASVRMNRCRFSGSIAITGNGTNNESTNLHIGGLVGEIRSAYISNSLYDGSITIAAGVKHQAVGGWVALVDRYNNSEIRRCLSHGAISIGSFVPTSVTDGTVVGSLAAACVGVCRKTLYEERCFYTTTRCDANTQVAHAAQIETVDNAESLVDNLRLGSAVDLTADPDMLFSAAFRKTLGEPDWAAVQTGYTYPQKDASHIHFYVDGFCTAGDGEYEKPTNLGHTYQIDNGGKLYWFATQFNEGLIPQDATVELMADIDMHGEDYTYPGIGSQARPFKGKFEGHGHTITGFRRDVINSPNTGLINYAVDATIKSFAIEGSICYNLATAQSFHGSIVGYADGTATRIEDVTSAVHLYIQNTRGRVVGGIAGRAAGTINRCRYSGHIAALDQSGLETFTTSGEQIGGIVGNGRSSITITNCLFDGKIWARCSEPIMRVSGILASNELNTGVRIAVRNCLVNACIDLQHTYVEPADVSSDKDERGNYVDQRKKDTHNGIIAGYWDSGLASAISCVYIFRECAEAMSGLTAGEWATTPSVLTITDLPASPDWQAVLTGLNSASSSGSESRPDWKMLQGATPIPNTEVCVHTYNALGFCTKCGARKPLVQDTDGAFVMDCIANLASFRDLVNSGTISEGTVLNAKLTQDIDFSLYDGDMGEPIGNTHFNRYLYNFDGQGYTLRNVHITSGSEFIGFFGYAGDPSHDCYIHDFTITGTIDVPYKSADHDDTPLYMGVVGKMYRGRIENVHSELTMTNTNPTSAMFGGILGCAETTDDEHAVVIDKCSYTGQCHANAVGSFGGIVGQTSKNTLITDCTFAGGMYHTYQGENNNTQFGGIVGKNDDPDFQGVRNCVVAGVLHTDANRQFVDYTREGNHKNILCGYDTQIADGENAAYNARYSGNYALEDYLGHFSEISYVQPVYVSQTRMASGEICALLNAADDGSHPWSQILGYQVGSSKTAGSPALRVPMPGYRDPEQTVYKVVKDANGNYTVDYYFFDDLGDATTLPSDAQSITAKRISYTRSADYMTDGFISVCMPFALTDDLLPGGAACQVKLFDEQNTTPEMVYFTTVAHDDIRAGVPYFLYLPESARGEDWTIELQDADGISLVAEPQNPASGILGSFNTVTIGTGYYKLNRDGNKLLHTTSTSSCFPYRGFLKLPASGVINGASVSFDDYSADQTTAVEQPDAPDADAASLYAPDAQWYNVLGQQVDHHATGIIICRGHKYFIR